MSRLYNSHTHSLSRHPIHKHESELPSSLNKRTQTQTRTNNSEQRLPPVRETFERDGNINNALRRSSVRETSLLNRCISFHAGKYWKCWCAWVGWRTNLAKRSRLCGNETGTVHVTRCTFLPDTGATSYLSIVQVADEAFRAVNFLYVNY